VKDAGGDARVLRQGVEEGRLEALRNAAQDVQVQVQMVFLIVEDPPAVAELGTGYLFDRLIGEQVDVEFGTKLGNHPAQFGTVLLGFHLFQNRLFEARKIAMQEFQRLFRLALQVVANNHRLHVVVEHHADQGIGEAGYEHRFIEEGVLGAAQRTQGATQILFLHRRKLVYEQDLEVEHILGRIFGGLVVRTALGQLLDVVVMRIASIAVAQQRVTDVAHGNGQHVKATQGDQFAEPAESVVPRESPVEFDRTQGVDQLDDFSLGFVAPTIRVALDELLAGDFQGTPAVGAQLQRAVVFTQRLLALAFCLHCLSPHAGQCLAYRYAVVGELPNSMSRSPTVKSANDCDQLWPGQRKSARPSPGQ
jgi:hypothetical protein